MGLLPHNHIRHLQNTRIMAESRKQLLTCALPNLDKKKRANIMNMIIGMAALTPDISIIIVLFWNCRTIYYFIEADMSPIIKERNI